MGAGNWLNPEGFLFGGAPFGGVFGQFARSSSFDRGRTMDMFVAELAGKAYQKKFWETWVNRYFGTADIDAMKRQGFNSVRLPVNARFLLDEEPGIHYILLQLDAGNKANYSLREVEKETPVSLICRSDGANTVRVCEGNRVLYEGSIPASDDFTALPVGMLSASGRSTLTVECMSGAVILKEIRSEV